MFGHCSKNKFSKQVCIMLILIKQNIYKARSQNTCPSISGLLKIFSSYFKILNSIPMTVQK